MNYSVEDFEGLESGEAAQDMFIELSHRIDAGDALSEDEEGIYFSLAVFYMMQGLKDFGGYTGEEALAFGDALFDRIDREAEKGNSVQVKAKIEGDVVTEVGLTFGDGNGPLQTFISIDETHGVNVAREDAQ